MKLVKMWFKLERTTHLRLNSYLILQTTSTNYNRIQLYKFKYTTFIQLLIEYSSDKLMKVNLFLDTLDKYMIRGILESEIPEDGGLACYQEIPFLQHTAFVVVLSLILLAFFFKWKHYISYSVKEQLPSKF